MSWEADVLADVLDQALARLTINPTLITPTHPQEETTAGSCWEIADLLDNQLHGMVA